VNGAECLLTAQPPERHTASPSRPATAGVNPQLWTCPSLKQVAVGRPPAVDQQTEEDEEEEEEEETGRGPHLVSALLASRFIMDLSAQWTSNTRRASASVKLGYLALAVGLPVTLLISCTTPMA